jgi:hypothetical protein
MANHQSDDSAQSSALTSALRCRPPFTESSGSEAAQRPKNGPVLGSNQ